MKSAVVRAGLILSLLLSFDGVAQDAVRIGLRPVPPYVMAKADGTLYGLEHDLIAEAMRRAGIRMEVQLYPFSRLVYAYDGVREVEAAAPVVSSFRVEGTLSKTYLTYQNVAATAARRNLRLSGLKDLGGLSVMAFQNARLVLGPEFAAAVENGNYAEQANQDLQVLNLMAGRIDTIIGERRIFRYFYTALHPAGPPYGQAITENRLFAETPYSVAFRNSAFAARFDTAFDSMVSDGTVTRLHQQYEALVPVSN